ncbi:MAG: DUF2946 family protein [Hyphomicrobium sp.]
MRIVSRTSQRPLSALVAVLLVLQAVLGAWHGAAMAAAVIGGDRANGTIVICTAHGAMRLTAAGDLLPADPAEEPSGTTIKCPLCLALSTDFWMPPSLAAPVAIAFRHAVIVPVREHVVAHAPRAPPQQRGPPSLA